MSITKISPSVVDFDAGITISTTDNSDNLTLTSTDADSSFGPNLNFYRNSSSPADDDLLAQIDFNGRNDNSQDVLYANIQTQIIDASDGTEDGRFQINTIVNGTDRNRFLLTPTETVFNDNSIDLDFRVESDGNANMLVVDAGKNAVGIGGSPQDFYTGYAQLSIGGLAGFAAETASSAGRSLHISQNAHLDTDGSWEAIATDESSNYYQHNGAHVFRSAAATTGGTDISWTTVGQFNTNGLCFGTDTAAANALDDYEEGTWTPIWQGLSSNGSTTWATQIGSYTKIGRLVVARFYFGGTWSGNYAGGVIINGLPFTANDNDSWQPIGVYNIDTNGEAVYTAGTSGQTYVKLYVTGSGTSWGQLNWSSSMGSSGNTCYLTGTISYFTAQ